MSRFHLYALFAALTLAHGAARAAPESGKAKKTEPPRKTPAKKTTPASRKASAQARPKARPRPRPRPTVRPIKPDDRFALLAVGPATLQSIRTLLPLYAGFEGSPLGKPVDDRALRTALAGAPFDISELQAAESLQKARLAFAALKRNDAMNLLRRAEAIYLRHVPLSAARTGIETVWTYLLLTLHDLGLKAEARAVARDLARLLGGKPPSGVPVVTWKLYTALTRRRKVTRLLKVHAPEKAKIYLDFNEAKPAPANKKQIPPVKIRSFRVDTSAHHLAVEAPGHRRFYARIPRGRAGLTVRAFLARQPADAHAKLRRALARLRAAKPEPGPKFITRSLKSARLHRVAVASSAGAYLMFRLLDLRTASFLGPTAKIRLPVEKGVFRQLGSWAKKAGKAVADAVEKAKKAVAAKIDARKSARAAARKVVAAKKPLKKGQKKKKLKPLYKRWYFWVAAACVAAVATAFALRKDEGNIVQVRVYKP